MKNCHNQHLNNSVLIEKSTKKPPPPKNKESLYLQSFLLELKDHTFVDQLKRVIENDTDGIAEFLGLK
jgi:hypothetical protein